MTGQPHKDDPFHQTPRGIRPSELPDGATDHRIQGMEPAPRSFLDDTARFLFGDDETRDETWRLRAAEDRIYGDSGASKMPPEFIIDPLERNEMKYPTVDKGYGDNRIPYDSIQEEPRVAPATIGRKMLDELSLRIAARDAGYNPDTDPNGYRAFSDGWHARGDSGR